MKDDGQPRLADALKARFLLMLGGVFGFHRFYLGQMAEAFIFLSTGGVFMLGIFSDSFYMHELVERYNQKQLNEEEENKKYRNGKLMPQLSKVVPFSFTQLVASQLYGMWLGFLCWIAGSVTFGLTMGDSLLMISAIAAAVSAGVYLIGNREGESRDLLYIWMAAFSTAFVVAKLFDGSCFRVLFLSTMTATLLGNRTARVRCAGEKSFNGKHYLFWSSLFALLICVIAIGASRHILDKRVSASRPGDSTVTSSIGSLVYDRFFRPEHVRSFFKHDPRIDYKRQPESVKESLPPSFWDLDLVGRAPDWANRFTVLIVDLLRAESRVLDGNLKEEPLKWAGWRSYLLVWFDVSPFKNDEQLNRLCAEWTKKQQSAKRRPKKEAEPNYAHRAVARGCEVVVA